MEGLHEKNRQEAPRSTVVRASSREKHPMTNMGQVRRHSFMPVDDGHQLGPHDPMPKIVPALLESEQTFGSKMTIVAAGF